MNNSQSMLTSVLKTAQMGQTGIRSVMKYAARPVFRLALQSQLREYDTIEQEACTLAGQRGWEPDSLRPSLRMMADAMTRMKLIPRPSDSKIADMMIQGNTRGLITSTRNIRRFHPEDSGILDLSRRLVDCEKANIRQMEKFL